MPHAGYARVFDSSRVDRHARYREHPQNREPAFVPFFAVRNFMGEPHVELARDPELSAGEGAVLQERYDGEADRDHERQPR